MKTPTFFGVTLALLAASTAPAQTESSANKNYVQASQLIGMRVKGADGDDIGTIKDVVLDRDTGCMAYTVLSTGGTGGTRMTGTSKTVPVPWTIYSPSSDPAILTVRVDRERIYSAPAFDYTRINEYSTGSYINSVYSYYGVQPAQTNLGVQVSPTPSITPTPTETPAVTPIPSASASPKTRATPLGRTTASPATTDSEGTEDNSSPVSKGRHHREDASPAASPSAGQDADERATAATKKRLEETPTATPSEKTARAKRHSSESPETSENSPSKPSKKSSAAKASPTP